MEESDKEKNIKLDGRKLVELLRPGYRISVKAKSVPL